MAEQEEVATYNPKEELWVSKDGTVTAVGDMHEEHAKNTLRMLIKQLRRSDLQRLAYHQKRLVLARMGFALDTDLEGLLGGLSLTRGKD